MFERGIATEDRKRQFQVTVTLEDGTVEKGTCSGMGGSLADILSAPSLFLELTDAQGRAAFFAKTSICKIESAEMPAADQLRNKERALKDYNPYKILGIDPETDEAGLTVAYHRLSKAYHPDRLTGLDMPREIVEYAASMQRRINSAFDEVRGTLKRKSANTNTASKPVFERRPSWAEKMAS